MKKLITKYIKNPMLQRMFIYAFSDGISRAMPFLVLPVIANYLTLADFGLATNFGILVQLLTVFISLSTALSLAVDYYKKDKGELVSNLIYLMTLLFLFTFIVMLLAHKLIYDWIQMELKWQLFALLAAYCGSVNQLYNTKVRYDEKPKLFGKLQFLRAGSAAGLSLLFVMVFRWTWQGRVEALIWSGILMAVVSFWGIIKESAFPKKLNWKVIYASLIFGLPLLPQTISQWFRSGFEKTLITKYVSLADNGLYSFSGTIASIFLLFTTSFFSAYTPYLFKSLTAMENNPEEASKIQTDLMKKSYYFIFAMFFILLGGYFFTYFLLIYFFKSAYHKAIIFMPYLLVQVFLSMLTSLFSSYILYAKKTKALGAITVVCTAIQAALTFFMIREFQTIGAAYSCVLSYIILLAVLFWYSQKIYPMPWGKFLLQMVRIRK